MEDTYSFTSGNVVCRIENTEVSRGTCGWNRVVWTHPSLMYHNEEKSKPTWNHWLVLRHTISKSWSDQIQGKHSGTHVCGGKRYTKRVHLPVRDFQSFKRIVEDLYPHIQWQKQQLETNCFKSCDYASKQTKKWKLYTFMPPIAEPIKTPHLDLSNSAITSPVTPPSSNAFLPAVRR